MTACPTESMKPTEQLNHKIPIESLGIWLDSYSVSSIDSIGVLLLQRLTGFQPVNHRIACLATLIASTTEQDSACP